MEAEAQGRREGRLSHSLLVWGEDILIALVLVVLLFSFFFRVVTVRGTSMSPSYNQGDRVLALAMPLSLKQGDVVLIGNIQPEPIIKRVIATEGQTVSFDYARGAVLVDGTPVDETAFGLENGVTGQPYTSFALLDFPQTVPEGCLFVLGDNRAVSEDSRYSAVGMIDRRNVQGKVLLRLFPAQED